MIKNTYVCLVFDEVKIKEETVYDKHSSEIIGFTDLDDVNNSSMQFQKY